MLNNTTQSRLERLDALGAVLSFGCAVHCFLLPILLTLAPVLGIEYLLHGTIHVVFVGATVCLATTTYCRGLRLHKSPILLLALCVAVTLLFAGLTHVESHDEAFYLGLGGLTLACGHLLNRKLCRSCVACQDDHRCNN